MQRTRSVGHGAEAGLEIGVGEGAAEVGVGDGGNEELVVGQDAVFDRVRVGVGVQARAEDLRIVHRGDQGGGAPGGGGCCGRFGVGACVWCLCQAGGGLPTRRVWPSGRSGGRRGRGCCRGSSSGAALDRLLRLPGGNGPGVATVPGLCAVARTPPSVSPGRRVLVPWMFLRRCAARAGCPRRGSAATAGRCARGTEASGGSPGRRVPPAHSAGSVRRSTSVALRPLVASPSRRRPGRPVNPGRARVRAPGRAAGAEDIPPFKGGAAVR